MRILRHASVDSTSERAFAAIAAGEARDGDVHVAEHQTAGRGRQGRVWESAPREGLYASLVLLPPAPPLSPTGLTMAAGLLVLDSLAALGCERVPAEAWKPWPAGALRLDWPNDVVAGQAKLAGTLVESRGLAPQAPHYVVGIGVNVRQTGFSTELTDERQVASLLGLGLDVPVERVLEELLERWPPLFSILREAPEKLAARYLEATGCHRRRVLLALGDRRYEGVLEELSLDGGISLRMKGGEGLRLPLEHVAGLELLERPT